MTLNYDFMKNKNLFLIISGVLLIISIALPFVKMPNFGIDFTGGSLVQIYDKSKTLELKDIRNNLEKNNIEANVITFGNNNEFLIKVNIKEEKNTETIFKELKKDFNEIELRRTEKIGSKVGGELVEKGVLALGLSIIIILMYISFRFEFKFAFASTVAIFHDVLITVAIINILDVQVNLEIIAGLLTILGYSLNDTIVVFDRIRENLNEMKETDLKKIINESVNQTLSRTMLTSLTTLFVVMSIYIFGGELVNTLALTLLIGIIIGTYSSIYIASSILILINFNVKEWKEKLATKEKYRKEREKQRAMFEQGTV